MSGMSNYEMFPPASRSTDPATSHMAEAKMNAGPRAVRMNQVLELIRKYPGCTAGELSRHMFKDHPELPITVSAETPHKRTTDLESKGLIYRGGIRKCLDSGRDRLTWWPVA